MRIRDVILALLVVVVWGANFTVISIGLNGVPPMLLASVRYVVVVLPAIFFVRRPQVSLRHLLAYGLTVGVGQFGALFYAMYLGMPAGLSSVTQQSQAFITLLFAAWLLREKTTWQQLAGMAVAAFGLLLFAFNRGQVDGAGHIPLAALLLALLAPTCWALSNIVVRLMVRESAARGQKVDMMGLVIWSALIPPIPLFGMALWLHGPQAIVHAWQTLQAPAIFSIAYLAYGATILGFGIWSALLAKYPAGTVAPFSLLVPVIGLLTAGLVLSERLTPLQWTGSACVVAGLLIAAGAGRIAPRRQLPASGGTA